MINVAIDCRQDLGPSDWRSMNRWQLEMFALHGSTQQKNSLIDFGYSGLPAWQFEYLYEMATGKAWPPED